jgi:uncharacterized protein (TIGR03086 family)
MTGSDTMLDLGPAAGRLATTLGRVGDDQLSAPTPCPDYRVADLLDHLMALTVAFRRAATKAPGAAADDEVEAPPSARGAASAGNLHPEWRRLLPARLDRLVAAWRDPAAWVGTTDVGGVTLPGATAGGFALNELLLHGWDLARATGQPFTSDPTVAEAALAFTIRVVEQGFGAYGPPVDISGDAPTTRRLLALAGRDPDWAP